MEPWGIPVIASVQSLNEPFVRILCCLFHKQFCISFKYALEKPHPSNFANSKLPDQCCMIAEVTTYPWPSGQRGRMQPQKSQFGSLEGRTQFPQFLISGTSCQRQMAGEVEDLIGLSSATYASAKARERKGVSHQTAYTVTSRQLLLTPLQPICIQYAALVQGSEMSEG